MKVLEYLGLKKLKNVTCVKLKGLLICPETRAATQIPRGLIQILSRLGRQKH